MFVRLIEMCLVVFARVMHVVWVKPVALVAEMKARQATPETREPILLLTAEELHHKICSKQLKCSAVVAAYITRIRQVNPLLNAVVHDRFEQAQIEARQVDKLIESGEYSASQLAVIFPLLGLPITVKESIAVMGMSNACGHVSRKKSFSGVAEKDAEIVAAIKQKGGIIICVTNTPQLCVSWECNNNLTGVTNNPYDIRRTSGGSSGGESALLACGGSILGVGSDLAGSLRLPCHFCGICGHKPTPRKVPPSGHFPDNSYNSIQYALGPLTRYASDLMIMYKAILPREVVEEMKLNEPVLINEVNIFYSKTKISPINSEVDGEYQKLIEDISRLCNVKYGNVVSEVKLNLRQVVVYSYINLLLMDKVPTINNISPTKNPYWEMIKYTFGRSDCILFAIMHPILQQLTKLLLTTSYKKFVNESLDKCKMELETMLGKSGVIIMPAFSSGAHYHNQIVGNFLDTSFIAIFNSLGLPVTTCPVGYDRNGLPLAVQIITRTNCDRVSITMATAIQKLTGGWKQPGNSISIKC